MEHNLLRELSRRGIPGILNVSAGDVPYLPGNFLAELINAARATGSVQLLVTGADASEEDRKPAVVARHLKELLDAFRLPTEIFVVGEPKKLQPTDRCYRIDIYRSEKT